MNVCHFCQYERHLCNELLEPGIATQAYNELNTIRQQKESHSLTALWSNPGTHSMCRSQDTRERSMKVGHLVLRLMGLQGAANNGKDRRAVGKPHTEVHLQSGDISGPCPCWFFSPCTSLGPWWATNKAATVTFRIHVEKPQRPKHFYNNAIKVEDRRVYVGMPGQHFSEHTNTFYRGETGR